MKMARNVPLATFGAATSQTNLFRGLSDSESGSTSPNTMISLPVFWSRMKNAELSIVVQTDSFAFDAKRRGDRDGDWALKGS